MKKAIFSGSCTAIVTPFKEGCIDFDRLKTQIEYQYQNGTSALVVCGTTGENATLSQSEHDELVRFSVNAAAGRMCMIAGVGSNNTVKALRNAENAKAVGADAVLMVTPYYNKTSQSGLVKHFTYVAERVDIPMILYNVPSRTGIEISTDAFCELSKHPNINGVKEASGDIALSARIRSLCGDELNIWSGNDNCILPMMALGAKGVISVASNIIPAAVSKLCALCLSGNYNEAETLQSTLLPLMDALFAETNPIPVKAAMRMLGTDSGEVRMPLTDIGEGTLAKLKRAMRDYGLNIA